MTAWRTQQRLLCALATRSLLPLHRYSSLSDSLLPQRHLFTTSTTPTAGTPSRTAPVLGGLKLVELAGVLAGPSVGQFFAELGVEVVKVENPTIGGDVTRKWKLPNNEVTPTAYFQGCNLGKKSVSIDLKNSEADRAALRTLISQADILTVSYKPGDAEKLGVDYSTVRKLNPRCIYAEITGYGAASGDERPGYDACIQAEAGFTYMNGEAGEAGGPLKMPVALVDILAAHHLKEAILLALLDRLSSGQGKRVSVSLLRAAVISTANQAAGYLLTGSKPRRMGSSHPSIVPYGTVFFDRERKPFVLAVGTDKQFGHLAAAVGLDGALVANDFKTNQERVKKRDRVDAALQAKFDHLCRDELLAELAALAVPAGAVKDMAEVFDHPEARQAVTKGRFVTQIGWDEPGKVPEDRLLDPPSTVGQHDAEFKN